MKSLEFESGMDNEKKVMVTLFWTNRKAARTEGCAPFLIKKIETANETYTPDGNKLLKISDDIMEDMVKTLDTGKAIPMKFNIGEENLSVILSADSFSVSVEKSPEIEEEIIEKLEMEFPKKFPSLCDSFKPRVMH
ncbi:hypothetical protein [Methanobacterium ferruginis]|jgi:hypothetical protein|uniref:hypothetical protein n=1 Tax=Methanobacterium ferruginis TaxID=710191 RepID=UPI002572B074|nr:hypothetical protein [Methanobacterium ferruginis]MCC7551268.1 hypothetical protein [Methanobacterium sp.]BDZ69165.1 hypothetical protein GCM10025860_26130 [Methanobacterium ferruginis]